VIYPQFVFIVLLDQILSCTNTLACCGTAMSVHVLAELDLAEGATDEVVRCHTTSHCSHCNVWRRSSSDCRPRRELLFTFIINKPEIKIEFKLGRTNMGQDELVLLKIGMVGASIPAVETVLMLRLGADG